MFNQKFLKNEKNHVLRRIRKIKGKNTAIKNVVKKFISCFIQIIRNSIFLKKRKKKKYKPEILFKKISYIALYKLFKRICSETTMVRLKTCQVQQQIWNEI